MSGVGAWLLDKFVHQSDVGEGTSCHDEIIATSSSIGVEIFWFNSLLFKPSCSAGGLGNVPSWRNMVSSDRVTEKTEDVGIFDWSDSGWNFL